MKEQEEEKKKKDWFEWS